MLTIIQAPTHEAKNEVDVICGSISEPEAVGSVDTSSESSRLEITRLIFKEDQRYSEAGRLISTNKPLPCKLELEPGWTESEELTAQKEYTQQMATRTLAFPPGRGLLYYNARVPLLTEKFPIPGFNLHCYFKNTQTTVGVEKQHFTEDKVNWAFFHAGVSAGLSISREAKGIDTSWIMYNKPSELSNRHGGFILALGLQGHLTDVAKWVAFKYLTMKHQMTTIGLLLGMAASRIGSMDTQVTKVLSIHVVRMQPPGSAELNLAPLIQTTALMGVGLNYCGSQHRRMSELMLSEIESMDLDEENQVLRDEGYRLSAGFALGFINLAKGNELGGMHDLHLAERLLKLAIGSKKVDAVHILDKCTAGAMVALALTFMKTENASLAKKLEIPKSRLQFGYTRPDIFLLRTLARNLIMWSEIEASQSWINKNIPDDYRDKADLRRVHELTTQDLAFYNILAGLLFSIALKYAGTGNVLIRHLLVGYLDQFMRLAELPANNFDEQLARATIRRHQDLLALCCATLMAGTGDLEVFRRLRILHGNRSSDVTFGSHMAASTAIGALFLGGGTHTFSTKPLAVGALIVAFYPIYPSTILDNKCHLQAFRHFWVLASEMRCIVTRDVDTNLPVHIPLQISLIKEKQNVQSKMASKYTPLMSLTSPCLLPAIEMIASITTGSREYWAVHLDFINEPAHRSAFEKTWTVYVKRRPAYAASDPWGSGTFRSTMWAIGDVDKTHKKKEVFEWLWQFDAFKKFTEVERELVLPTGGRMIQKGLGTTLVDTRLVLQNCTVDAGKRDRLEGAKGLFEWAQGMAENKNEPRWVRREAVLDVKAALGEKEVESDEKENGGWIEKADVDEEDDEYGYERKEGVERVVQEGEEENEYWEGDYGVQ